MIRQLPPLNYQRIKRVSPSQLYSLKACPYKLVLYAASDKISLLPIAPAACFGSILHKMMEGITKGIIKTDKEFDESFDNYIQEEEKNLQAKGFGYFVPLKNNIKDFGLKKAHVRSGLRTNSKTFKPEKISFDSEKWLSSKDGTIGGKLDLVIRNEDDVEIVDFKTGSVIETNNIERNEAAGVKQEYQVQLKLYAQLFFEEYGVYPNRISLQTLEKNKYRIPFTPEECRFIYTEAKEILNKTNESVETGNFIANPSAQNCRNCSSRPLCSFYQAYLSTSQDTNDIVGTVERVEQAANGNVSIWLKGPERLFHITHLGQEFYHHLYTRIGKPISVYNLWKEKQLPKYRAINATTIYE